MEELACGLFLLSKGGEKGGVMPRVAIPNCLLIRCMEWPRFRPCRLGRGGGFFAGR